MRAEGDAGSAAEPVPVSVLTGFLGAGKTTLVNRVLADPASPRCAVLVNEIGAVPIDGALVVASDEEVIELANGCVCCSLRGDLVAALAGLLERRRRGLFRAARPFERVLVETSGLASPGPLLQTLRLEPGLAAATRADGVVTVCHAARIADQLAAHPEAREQVGYADLLLLNHVDRASAAEREEAVARLRAVNAVAPVQAVERAAVDPRLLFGLGEGQAHAPDAPLDAGTSAHAHTPDASTVVLRSRAPLDLHALKLWLAFLARRRTHELWRAKGVLACREVPDRVVVQAVYQWLELGPTAGAPPEESVLVLIGRDLDRAELARGWAAVGGEGGADAPG